MFQQFESQPLISVPWSRFETADALPRQSNGTITTFWVSRSFIRMKWAARLTGSISVSAARKSRSYSSLRQRVALRPAHLFSFCEASHDTKGSMNRCGSGDPELKLYICRSAVKWEDVSRLAGAGGKETGGAEDIHPQCGTTPAPPPAPDRPAIVGGRLHAALE